jgi:magnesium-transporting ATPase (P-type)
LRGPLPVTRQSASVAYMNPQQTQQYFDLDIARQEYRLKYERISNDYNSLQTKILALLAVQLTISAFIFSQARFIPKEPYGKIFFWAGTLGIGVSILITLFSAHSNKWMIPPGEATLSTKIRQKFVGIAFLDLLFDDYKTAYDYCAHRYYERSRLFD